MREPFTRLYVHRVWATWDRQPLLSATLRRSLYACIQQECRDLKGEALAVGGTEDHVHVLVRISAAVSVASLVKQIKGSSSHLATHRVPGAEGFKWQGAYGAFTVSHSEIAMVEQYIRNQEDHHRQGTVWTDYEPQ